MNFKILLVITLLICSNQLNAQKVSKKLLNWYNGAKYGMSTELAYKELLAEKKSTTVIVAVIDSGVDIEHEDLKGVIWVNEDEIADNGIDDDNNGYIDDVNGWSFLGNSEGENVDEEQLEMTRLYSKYDSLYKGKSYVDLDSIGKIEYDIYKEVRELVEKNIKDSKKSLKRVEDTYEEMTKYDNELREFFGGDYTSKQLKKAKSQNKIGETALKMEKMGGPIGYGYIKEYVEYYEGNINYYYNKVFNARLVQGDNPSDFSDVNYGSKDVEGPDAMHGTHCSGIIAAVRGNGIGNDGVADNVRIMSVRAVPNGDERDKDVALAIRYAVDNGASVVNMSFGKGYSPYAEEVIKAIRYAEENDVLLVHAAGNDSKDIDSENNFPSPQYKSMSDKFTNWIEVGASTKNKKHLAAGFSNYGDKMVDVFAPGTQIYSTVPQSEYEFSQGTSMAAPMVTGVAALLKSYFPSLTMLEIKEIIFKSVKDVSKTLTPLPGTYTSILFKELCVTGGIVNVYNAVVIANEKVK